MFYIMIAKVNLSIRQLNTMPIDEVLTLYNKYYVDSMNRDIFEISLAGGDVKEIPHYSEYLAKMQKKSRPKYATMNDEEAKTYRNIFSTALSRMKNGK